MRRARPTGGARLGRLDDVEFTSLNTQHSALNAQLSTLWRWPFRPAEFFRQLFRIDRIISFHVVRFAVFEFLFQRPDDQPKNFFVGIVERLSQGFWTTSTPPCFGTVIVWPPIRIRPVPSTTK